MPKFALYQFNPTLGAMADNAQRIIAMGRQARSQNADLLITPEMSVTGYPAEDAWLSSAFIEQSEQAVRQIAAECVLPTLVGAPCRLAGKLYNGALLLGQGTIQGTYLKQCLPNYSVFDEHRYFQVGDQSALWEIAGVRCGILICEDIWHPLPLAELRRNSAQCVIVINASPYRKGCVRERWQTLSQINQEHALPLLYVNTVGGQDELVFDGNSMAINVENGALKLAWQAPAFAETLAVLDFHQGSFHAHSPSSAVVSDEVRSDFEALSLSLSDYLRKNHFHQIFLGLSGGIDSAVCAGIATHALGKDRVTCVMMPSRYSAAMSEEDAQTLAHNLGVRYERLSIEPMYQATLQTLNPLIGHLPPDITEENIQARLRGLMLMALANKHNGLVINTSNKSECAMGYGTLYGDMIGGFALLKDLYKHEVYALARYINRAGEVIPARILTRAPSAELRHHQTDQQTLPPYEVLDEILFYHLERGYSAQALYAMNRPGWSVAVINKILRAVSISEYKRAQAPMGTKLSSYALGKDRRMPITNAFRDTLEDSMRCI